MKYRAILILLAMATPSFAYWHAPMMTGGHMMWGRPVMSRPIMSRPIMMPYMGGGLYQRPMAYLSPMVMQQPVLLPGGGYQQLPPQQAPAPGFTRAECVDFDFHGRRPSAELKLRIQRTPPENRHVLYQRALYTLKFDTDVLAKGTADWVRTEIEHLAQ